MKGRRVKWPEGNEWLESGLQPGDYAQAPNGVWYAVPPGCTGMGNLSQHDVTEHGDGTITVSPSILVVYGDEEEWHGYLEHGIWREC